jgi:hypothetical protein
MDSPILKAWEECDKIDTLFIIFCTTICWTIVPTVRPRPSPSLLVLPKAPRVRKLTTCLQVGIAYSGYSWKRNALTSAMPAVLTIATCSVQWFIIGYTLAYGEGGLVFGSFKHLFHRGVLSEPVGTIPAILFSEFQLVFEATVCAIAVGGFCERGRLLPVIPFIFLWSTFIYCPLAHMVWGGGWLGENLGVLDFAGGRSSYCKCREMDKNIHWVSRLPELQT